MKELLVWWRRELVGSLRRAHDDTMEFLYDRHWAESPTAFPISLSMPVRAEPYRSEANSFFANLLPEADVRARLCQRLKVSLGNDFELLRQIGGECAGALTIGEAPPSDAFGTADYRTIDPEQLRRWSVAKRPDVFSSTVGHDGVRLSLAGAQDKLPVFMRDDTVSVPLGMAPSTHLLKFSSPHFKHLPENEYLMALVAGRLGLPVAPTALLKIAKGKSILVVERYDRRRDGAAIVRLHQEDCCQASGRSHLRKYQKEGGPSLGEIAEILRRHGSLPGADLPLLVRWGVFNWLFGNGDGHGKNISLLLGGSEGIRLAPFYDLVCTRVYPSIDRHLAMSLGDQFDPGEVGSQDLEAFARAVRVSPRLVRGVVDEMLATGNERLGDAIAEFRARSGESPMLDMVRLQVARNLRRAATMLGTSS